MRNLVVIFLFVISVAGLFSQEVLIEDFNSMPAGNVLNGQNGWTAPDQCKPLIVYSNALGSNIAYSSCCYGKQRAGKQINFDFQKFTTSTLRFKGFLNSGVGELCCSFLILKSASDEIRYGIIFDTVDIHTNGDRYRTALYINGSIFFGDTINPDQWYDISAEFKWCYNDDMTTFGYFTLRYKKINDTEWTTDKEIQNIQLHIRNPESIDYLFLRLDYSIALYGSLDDIYYNKIVDRVPVTLDTVKKCSDDFVELKSESTVKSNSYLWSTGETTKSIMVKQGGEYSLTTFTDSLCPLLNKFVVINHPKTKLDLLKSGRLDCENDKVTIHATKGLKNYYWSNLSSEDSIVVKKEGWYILTAVDQNGCVVKDSIFVEPGQKGNHYDSLLFETSPVKFSFDTVTVGNNICKWFKIINPTDQLIILDNVVLFYNTEFSIPQSQFPITIRPHDTEAIKICSRPRHTRESFDTIFIMDACSKKMIPLKVYGFLDEFIGESVCNNKIVLQVFQKYNKLLIRLPEEMLTPNFEENNHKEISLYLYDIYGRLIYRSASIIPAKEIAIPDLQQNQVIAIFKVGEITFTKLYYFD